MSFVAVARVAIPLVTFGAVAALGWGAWAWLRCVRGHRGARAERGPAAVPPATPPYPPAVASRPVDESRAASGGGWSLDLSDEP
jgi:hypothetical protein